MIEFNENTLDDVSVPDFTSVDAEAIMKIFGWRNRNTITRQVGKMIPPPTGKRNRKWTVGQLRDWRVRIGIQANERAARLNEECVKLAARETAFEQAALP